MVVYLFPVLFAFLLNKRKEEKDKVISGRCYVGNPSTHLNTKVQQHWARIALGWKTAWKLLVLLTNPSWDLQLRECLSQTDGQGTLLRCAGSGIVLTVFQTACYQPLQSGPPESWPLEWGQKCGAVNMVRSCKEGVAVKQSRSRSEGCSSKFGTSKDFFLPNLF